MEPESLASDPNPLQAIVEPAPGTIQGIPLEIVTDAVLARGTRRWITVLLIAIALSILTAEAITTVMLGRMSQTEKRIRNEYLSAVQLRSGRALGRTEILFVGNSLLKQGVDLNQLNESLGPSIHVTRFAIEGPSTYYDWYYGLKGLFAKRMHPDAIAVLLTARQLASSGFRGEYFANRLMRLPDIFRLSREIHLHPTMIINRVIAHFSLYYSSRDDVRFWFFKRIVPNYQELTDSIQSGWGPLLDADLKKIPGRIRALKQLTAEHKVHLIFILPPQIRPDLIEEDRRGNLEEAMSASGVPLITTSWEAFSAEDYLDNYHLTEAGAVKYSRILAPVLGGTIENLYGERQTR